MDQETTIESIRLEEHRAAVDRLYGHDSALVMFQYVEIDETNKEWFQNLFKLIYEYKSIDYDHEGEITARGRDLGFSDDESLVIFNMLQYWSIAENLSIQKEELFKQLLECD